MDELEKKRRGRSGVVGRILGAGSSAIDKTEGHFKGVGGAEDSHRGRGPEGPVGAKAFFEVRTEPSEKAG